ncbi:ATP-binding protein [Amycolatopsis kentuckyensis]|uniref:ATP-binding protein n=1 Tax=Amycolatopsis kentuckyensis TaxID=218823 RepID=UPI001178585D|nr:ATP-binding protein [Amycolatopsis kentuckyensis]
MADLGPIPARLDDALARMAGRLAGVLDGLGDATGAEFLRSRPGPSGPGAPDGGCLDLPAGPAEPVDRLGAALGLGATDGDLLLLTLLGHQHEGTAAVLRGLHPCGEPWATTGLAARLAELGGLGAVVHSRAEIGRIISAGPLARAGAVRAEGAEQPFPERSLRPAPLLWDALAGLAGWPDGVELLPGPYPHWGFDGWLAQAEVAGARRVIERDAAVTVLLPGPRQEALAGRLAALVGAAGRQAVVLWVRELDATTVRGIQLLARVRGVVPVLCADGGPRGDLGAGQLPVPLLLALPDRDVRTWPRPVLELPAGPLPAADRRAALRHALPELGEPPDAPIGPAGIEPGEVALAAADVRVRAELAREPAGWDRMSERTDAHFVGAVPPGAVLLHPRARWADLILPADRLAQLREAVERMRGQDRVLAEWGFDGYGVRGLRLLLAGPPGTGKTLAAEVIAAELGRDLLAVDLSQLVSKWIGETEKNLAEVFDAAERDGAVLLFDEADALFGKRTEVGDGRDRYANLQTAYLLGRLERFTGVAVLATNLRQNLDSAFARRIEFAVMFDPPDEAGRLALWRRHLPAAAPHADDLDLPLLAALYPLSGALIRNAAVAAAFLAAADPEPGRRVLGRSHLVHALRREHAKAGLSFPGPPTGPAIRRGPS